MRLGIVIALVLFSKVSFGQSWKLSGYITNQGNPIHGAHIYNRNSRVLTITNPEGRFAVPVQLKDSILISHVGFESIDLQVDSLLVSESLYISLKSNSILLDEVQVSFPTYPGFKEQILATIPTDSSFQVYGLEQVDYSKVSFPAEPSTEDPEMRLSTGGVGARFDLEGITKRGKEKKKFRKLKAQEEVIQKANLKYTREWVSKVTNLQGDELTNFMSYCNFSPEYIVKTPIYIIQEDMMLLLDKFQSDVEKQERDQYTPGS